MHRYWWWCSSSSTRRGRDRLVNIPRPISRCTSVQRSPLAERIATRAFDEKSRHRPWIFFTSTTLKPNQSFPLSSIVDEFLRVPFRGRVSLSLLFTSLSSLITFILDRREIEFASGGGGSSSGWGTDERNYEGETESREKLLAKEEEGGEGRFRFAGE